MSNKIDSLWITWSGQSQQGDAGVGGTLCAEAFCSAAAASAVGAATALPPGAELRSMSLEIWDARAAIAGVGSDILLAELVADPLTSDCTGKAGPPPLPVLLLKKGIALPADCPAFAS